MSKAHPDVAKNARGQDTSEPAPRDTASEPSRKHRSATEPRPRQRRVPSAAAGGDNVYMTSTEAQNGFGRVLDAVARGGTVLITKHNATQAVVMSAERYQALTRDEDPDLDQLEAEYDELIAKMQTPEAVRGALEALRASPEELGRFAVEAARNRKASR